MGKIQKGIVCSVDNCDNSAIRSKSKKSIDSDILSISSDANKAYLCKTHYKDWKKATKDSRKNERALLQSNMLLQLVKLRITQLRYNVL